MSYETIIVGLRTIALVGWAVIAWASLPAWWRVLTLDQRSGDWANVALGIVGVSIVGYQVNLLVGGLAPRDDYWTAAMLFLQASAAGIVVGLVHNRRCPPANKRALVISQMAVIGLCIVGGALG